MMACGSRLGPEDFHTCPFGQTKYPLSGQNESDRRREIKPFPTRAASRPMHVGNPAEFVTAPCAVLALGDYRDLLGNRPHASCQLTGNGHRDRGGMFAACDELPIAFTEPDLGFPTDVLDDFGLCFQSQVYVSADLGGIAVGPGPFD
jgi:hypothetical protein